MVSCAHHEQHRVGAPDPIVSSVAEPRTVLANPQSARGQQRLSKILEAATEAFLQEGYDNTSIDAILARSGGSKATLYQYFPTKADLFRAVIDAVVLNSSQPELDTAEDIRTALTRFGTERLRVIFSAQHRALLRLVIAEQERFPDLARMYYDRGPLRSHDTLTGYLNVLQLGQRLSIEDTDEAAEFYVGMLLHRWYKEMLLLGAAPPSHRAILRRAEHVADRFVEAFRLTE